MELQFWYDFSCPYAYLASTKIEAVAAQTGATLVPCPMLLGGVFAHWQTPQALYATLPPPKAAHNQADLLRQAKRYGINIGTPHHHPMRTVDALRAVLAAGEPFWPLSQAFFRAYWADGVDISSREGLSAVLQGAGHDAASILERAESAEIKAELRRRTDDAIARQIFGAPTCVVDDVLYWGADRLDYVALALGGQVPTPTLGPKAPVDFWFDYSSPYTFLASQRVDAVLGDAARWRPMLLGGLFRQVGTPDVPLFAASAARQAYHSLDLARQAKRYGIQINWPSRFPMNTVLPLRLTLAVGPNTPRGRALAHAIFRAFWVHDLDISSPEVLAPLCAQNGIDAEFLARAQEPGIKAALKAETEAAAARGVFGAPTFVVQTSAAAPEDLFWGVDRLDWAAERAAEAI